jgi:hypothetical protein
LLRIIIAAANKKWGVCSYAVGFACHNHRASSPKSQLGLFRQNAPRMLALMLRSIRSATRVQVVPPAKRAAMRL